MEPQRDARRNFGLLDRILGQRHVAFWTLLASIAAVIGLIYTFGSAITGTPQSHLSTSNFPSMPTSVLERPPNNPTPSPFSSVSGSIVGSSPSNLPGPEIKYLDGVKPVTTSGRVYDLGPQKVDASVYPHSLYALSCPACYTVSPEYDLGRSWTNFHATIGLSDDSSDSTVVLQFEVFADGKLVGKINRLGLGQHIEINESVAGALRLKLVLTRVSGGGQAKGVWGDASLSR